MCDIYVEIIGSQDKELVLQREKIAQINEIQATMKGKMLGYRIAKRNSYYGYDSNGLQAIITAGSNNALLAGRTVNCVDAQSKIRTTLGMPDIGLLEARASEKQEVDKKTGMKTVMTVKSNFALHALQILLPGKPELASCTLIDKAFNELATDRNINKLDDDTDNEQQAVAQLTTPNGRIVLQNNLFTIYVGSSFNKLMDYQKPVELFSLLDGRIRVMGEKNRNQKRLKRQYRTVKRIWEELAGTFRKKTKEKQKEIITKSLPTAGTQVTIKLSPLKPHEERALAGLISEYINNYCHPDDEEEEDDLALTPDGEYQNRKATNVTILRELSELLIISSTSGISVTDRYNTPRKCPSDQLERIEILKQYCSHTSDPHLAVGIATTKDQNKEHIIRPVLANGLLYHTLEPDELLSVRNELLKRIGAI
ncbi:hypothetical protein BLNAU_25294 [Blattamonas nauphoetae]|uniref:Uncharacterized protein n=1 Tax=Blattamonas nauphoetae TaxID=2049346 RepID=A0ABQ9WJZ0_9EUKA|nr:hypothetical protein BLNAU_25294 [Blattamonas nauphoetae]